MKLAKYLANLGYGSRREVEALVARGRVTRAGGGPLREGDPFAHDEVRVDGDPLDPAPGAVVMLHKPAGYTTSTRDRGPLVYELLPPRFARRSPLMAPAGRLDRDTTGLLLLTDDGALNHRVTSPRRHLPRVYQVRLAADLRGDEGAVFASGELVLQGEEKPLLPAALEPTGPRAARLTLSEGRYHQVKRMFAAVGNHVEALHRAAIGGLQLGELEEGRWRVLAAEEVARIFAGG